MNNFIKTTVRKLAELPWPDLRDLFTWPSNGSPVNAENPNLLVAKATDEHGDVVAYVTAENIMLVGSYVFNPTANPNEVSAAADYIDKKLAETANVQRMWIVVPPEAPPIGGEKRIRVVERKVYQPGTPQPRVSFDFDAKQQIAYLN